MVHKLCQDKLRAKRAYAASRGWLVPRVPKMTHMLVEDELAPRAKVMVAWLQATMKFERLTSTHRRNAADLVTAVAPLTEPDILAAFEESNDSLGIPTVWVRFSI